MSILQTLGVKVDKGSIKEADKELSVIDSRLDKIGDILVKGAKYAKEFGKSFTSAFKRVPTDTAKAKEEQEKYNDSVKDGTEALKRYSDQFGKVSNQYSTYGDVDSSLVATAGLAGNFGGGGQALAQGGIVAADFLATAEALPKMATAVKELGRRAIEGSGVIKVLSGAMVTAVPAISATTASMIALAGVALAVVGAVGGVIFAMQAYNRSAEEQRRQLAGAIEAQRTVNEAIAEGATSEDAQNRIQEIQRQLEVERELLSTREQAYDSMEQQISDNFGVFGGIVETGIRAFDSREQELSDSISEARDNVVTLEAELNRWTQALDDNVFVQNDAIVSMEEAQQREAELQQQRDASLASIDQLIAQEASLIENRSLQTQRLYEDRQLADSRRDEDEELREEEHENKLYEISLDGNERLQDLQADAIDQRAKLEKKGADSQIKVVTDTQDKIDKIEKDYRVSDLKDRQQFAKDRLRAIEDLNQTIFEATLNNDIVGLRLAQRQSELESQRKQDDFDEDSRERAEQKEARLAELRDEQDIRISELKAGLAEERRQLDQSLRERTLAERTAIEERLNAELEAEERRDTQRELQESRREEDERIADQRREYDFDRQLERIQTRRQAEEDAYRSIINSIGQVTLLANNLSRQTNTNNNTNTNTPSRNNSGGRGGSGVQQFAEGGIIPPNTPVLAEFEGHRSYAEAVLPLNSQNLSRFGVGGSSSPSMSYRDINIYGDGVTRSEVQDALLKFHRAHLLGVQDAINRE